MKKSRPAEKTGAAESPSSLARRKFVNSIAAAAGGGCLLALGATLVSREARALPAQAIRPPGALPEKDFLAAAATVDVDAQTVREIIQQVDAALAEVKK